MSALPLSLIEVSALYGEFLSPFTIERTDIASSSTLFQRRKAAIPNPKMQSGPAACPPLDNVSVPEVSITFIPNAIVTSSGAVIYNDEHLIAETVEGSPTDNGLIENGDRIYCKLEDLEASDEIVLCINRNGTWNYSLFLSEIVPLALVCTMNTALAGLRAPIFFRSFMDETAITNRKQLLAMFGLAADRLFVPSSPLTRYKGAVLVKVNDRYKNHRISQMMPYVSGKLRAELATPKSPHSRRLYISRQASASRRIINFEQLMVKVIEPFDLSPVELDNMPLQEQVDLFSKADLVVAEHGAGLVNTMFMRPGSTLVEVMPDRLVGRWMYRLIAHHGQLNYIFGSLQTPEAWRWNQDDVAVPCELYQHLLENIE